MGELQVGRSAVKPVFQTRCGCQTLELTEAMVPHTTSSQPDSQHSRGGAPQAPHLTTGLVAVSWVLDLLPCRGINQMSEDPAGSVN